MVLIDDLRQRPSEIANQRTADAAGIHLGNVDARILQEAAVNADLAEFILNQNDLLALVGFPDHLLDQSGFAGAQETGINVNFCHCLHLLYKNLHPLLYTNLSTLSTDFSRDIRQILTGIFLRIWYTTKCGNPPIATPRKKRRSRFSPGNDAFFTA